MFPAKNDAFKVVKSDEQKTFKEEKKNETSFTKRRRHNVVKKTDVEEVKDDQATIGSLFGRAPLQKTSSQKRNVESSDEDDNVVDDYVIKQRFFADARTASYDAVSLSDNCKSRRTKCGKKVGETFLDIVSHRVVGDVKPEVNKVDQGHRSGLRFPGKKRLYAFKNEESVDGSSICSSRGSSVDFGFEDVDRKPLIEMLD